MNVSICKYLPLDSKLYLDFSLEGPCKLYSHSNSYITYCHVLWLSPSPLYLQIPRRLVFHYKNKPYMGYSQIEVMLFTELLKQLCVDITNKMSTIVDIKPEILSLPFWGFSLLLKLQCANIVDFELNPDYLELYILCQISYLTYINRNRN